MTSVVRDSHVTASRLSSTINVDLRVPNNRFVSYFLTQVNDTDCNRVLLAEDRDGVDIHPFSTWTFRKNPDETAKVQLLVTKFGHPLSNTNVKIAPCNCGSIFSGGPEVGQPPLPVQHPESTTDVNGIATFNIKAQDPQNKRGYIDGQLYPFSYVVEGRQSEVCSDTMCKNDPFKLLNSLIVILVWDNYTQKGAEPTWLDDVFPIFKQYANLYPVMADHFVDLADYYDVVNHRKAISGSMHFPMSHPNYMPATRDLSSSKRQVILEWLSKGKPVIGNPEHFYSVEHLQKDLQTALQLEHSTIPPYLTALASIKFSYNLEVQSVLKEVIIQEMMHMALVANILNAVGGQPSLYSKDFIPLYPSRLPGGVQPHLIVPIEKLSLGLIRNIFMKIEQPELEQKRMSSFQHAFAYTENLKLKKMVQERERHCQKDEKGESCSEQNYLMFMSLPPTDSLVDDKLSSCFTSPSVDQTQKGTRSKLNKLISIISVYFFSKNLDSHIYTILTITYNSDLTNRTNITYNTNETYSAYITYNTNSTDILICRCPINSLTSLNKKLGQ